jgi:hypothetical protein
MFKDFYGILAIIVVTGVFLFNFFVKKKEGKDWIYAVYFIVTLFVGTILYSFALIYNNDKDTVFSPFLVILKSLSYSLKSFGGDFYVSVTSALAKENNFFHIAVIIHFIASVFLTFLVVVKIFGKNMINIARVFFRSKWGKYIVIGCDGQADIFLKSFDYKKRRKTTVILEAHQKNMKNDLFDRNFAVVVIKDSEEKNDIAKETCEALKYAGFNRNEKKIISMSESDELNLLVAKIVTNYIKSIVMPTKNKEGRIELSPDQEGNLEKIMLSAYIMYKMLDRTEHFAFIEYAFGRVRFFNPYEVRARKFMQENPVTSLIPKSWINTKKARLYNAADEGFKTNRIGNIFIGYGETNKHILKKSICNYQLLGMDYNALIIDNNAIKLEKQFQNSAPGLFTKNKNGSELQPNPDGTVYYPNPEENYNIKFVDLNILTSDFYNRVIQEIIGTDDDGGLDFASIIISLGSDKLSIETALELRQKLYERRLLKRRNTNGIEYDRVRFFVKIFKESVLTDKELLNDENDINSEIIVFGASDEILNEDYIIHEKLDYIAKCMANEYWEIAGGNKQKSNIISKWDTLTDFKRDSNRYAAMSIRTKLNLLGFELKEGESKTDNRIVEGYESSYGIAVSEKQRMEKKSGKFVDFVERDDKGNIIDNARNNLARLEHQRWNTLHLVSGWTKLPIGEVTADTRQDEKAKQHACITTFEGLSGLRKRQANDALTREEKNGKNYSIDKAFSVADTICYDFDMMDRLLDNLKNSRYFIVLADEDEK